jgi:hypothetical protein
MVSATHVCAYAEMRALAIIAPFLNAAEAPTSKRWTRILTNTSLTCPVLLHCSNCTSKELPCDAVYEAEDSYSGNA